MAEIRALLAGFGGQGVLFAGKVTATAGLIEGRELSWLPSYGPEMRGGTANCSVTLSDDPIGSPLVLDPNLLIAMNQPSFDKFIGDVVPGGVVVVNADMVPSITPRDDVKIVSIPAQELAEQAGKKVLANMVLLGKAWAETEFCSRETLDAAVEKAIPARLAHMLDVNLSALQAGIDA